MPPNKPITYAPQEEKTHASSRTKCTGTRRDCPQRSGKFLAKPVIHRPQILPTDRNQQDFSCRPQVQAQRQTLFQHIGFHPPVQETNICRAPDNAPTRVDVASRYLGNKACKHETVTCPNQSRCWATWKFTHRGSLTFLKEYRTGVHLHSRNAGLPRRKNFSDTADW